MVHPAYLVYEHCFQANETNPKKKKKKKKEKERKKKKTNKRREQTSKQKDMQKLKISLIFYFTTLKSSVRKMKLMESNSSNDHSCHKLEKVVLPTRHLSISSASSTLQPLNWSRKYWAMKKLYFVYLFNDLFT